MSEVHSMNGAAVSLNLTSDRPTEENILSTLSFFVLCLLCFCFPVTDRVASGAKRRSPTLVCGSRG